MKRIDLHMHTVATASDRHFVFSMDRLSEYVDAMKLDAIAITNHNMFDLIQYQAIASRLSIPVFPGIEVDVDSCHILVIVDPSQVDLLEVAAQKISTRIPTPHDCISVEELLEIISPIDGPLVIPHYDKKPAIRPAVLEKLRGHVTAGEVDSAKKFIRNAKNNSVLVPVLFSDVRISESLARFPTRHTFIDCGDLSLSAIKSCLNHHNKVALSVDEGNSLIQVLEDGLRMSTGLNVLLGDRSSGKTHLLNRIHEEQENVKYIKQFSLVQQNEAAYEKDFASKLEQQQSNFTEEYLASFKAILNDVVSIDIEGNDRQVATYLDTLIQSAEAADRADAYSKASLFSETHFTLSSDDSLKSLIASVRQLIENVDYRETIQKHVNLASLRALALELIETLWGRTLETKKNNSSTVWLLKSRRLSACVPPQCK